MGKRIRSGAFGVGLLAFLSVSPVEGAPSPTLPVSSRPPARSRAYYLYSLAQQARFARDYVAAVEYLEQAARVDDSADLNAELADFYYSLSQVSEAEQRARQALEQDPSHVGARKTLARILVNRAPAGGGEEGAREEAERLYRSLVEEGERDDDVYLALADSLLERKDEGGAAAVLEKFRSVGNSSDVSLRLARLYEQMGRSAEATQLLEGLLSRDPGNLEAGDTLASAMEEEGRYQEAAEVRRRLVERNPRNLYARYRLGTDLLALGQFSEALQELMPALQADPRNLRVLLAIGQAYEGNGQPQMAENTYREALLVDASSQETRFSLARHYQRQANRGKALDLYRQILEDADPNGSPTEQAYFVLAHSQIGLLLFLEKNYDGAIASLQQARDASPDPAEDLQTLLARVYVSAGRLADAGRAIAEGRTRFPDSLGFRALEGEKRLRQGDREGAAREFRGLVEAGEGSEEAYLEVLRVCYRADQPREAEFWIREARRRHPDSRDLKFQAAAHDERMGRFREAERGFRLLLREDPEDGEALNYLGYMLADRGIKLEEALGFLQRAVALEPDNAAFLDSLGWVFFRLGRLPEAEVSLRKAAAGADKDPTIYDHLGDTLSRQGKLEEALAAYRTALENEPEKPREIKKKIRRIAPELKGP